MSRYGMTCPVCGRDMDYIEESHGEISEFGYSFFEPGYWECPFCSEIVYENDELDEEVYYAVDVDLR